MSTICPASASPSAHSQAVETLKLTKGARAAPDARLSLFAGNLPATSPTAAPSAADSDAHLYFLLARNRHIPKRERLVLWLNGGPGCSSFDGALVELGPIRVNDDGTLRVVQGTAWNEYANVLFCELRGLSCSQGTAR